MSVPVLYQQALESGQFPGMTARRLRKCRRGMFAPRYLGDGAAPARHLQQLLPTLGNKELFAVSAAVYLPFHPKPGRLYSPGLLAPL